MLPPAFPFSPMQKQLGERGLQWGVEPHFRSCTSQKFKPTAWGRHQHVSSGS